MSSPPSFSLEFHYTYTMLKHYILIGLFGILVLLTTFLVYQSPRRTSTVIVNNTGRLNQLELKNICDCYLLVGGLNQAVLIDSLTGEKVDTDMIPLGQNLSYYDAPSISPSGTSLLSIQNFGTSIYYQKDVNTSSQLLYLTPNNEVLGLPQWSVDERYVGLAVQDPGDVHPSEGLWASSIKLLNVQDKSLETVISRNQTKELGLENIFPLAISAGAKTVWFSSGTMDNQRLFSWSNGTRQSTEIKKPIYSSVFYAQAKAKEQSVFLSYQSGKLHQYTIDTGEEKILPLDMTGDAPVSVPSRDNQQIVYLKRVQTESLGIPTLYNLSNGIEKQLTKQPIPVTSGLPWSIWSPDGKYFIYAEAGWPTMKYFALRLDQEQQVPQQIYNVPILDESQHVYGLIEKPIEIKTHVSTKLNIQFSYASQDLNKNILTQELGDTVYVYYEDTEPTSGQSVQVFTKDPKDSLQQAIEKKFLIGYDKTKCYVRSGTDIHSTSPDSGLAAVIAFPVDQNANDDGLSNAKNCPAGYALTNGLSYFWTEAEDSDKFVFFSIGQYFIPSSTEGTSWHTTLQFIK